MKTNEEVPAFPYRGIWDEFGPNEVIDWEALESNSERLRLHFYRLRDGPVQLSEISREQLEALAVRALQREPSERLVERLLLLAHFVAAGELERTRTDHLTAQRSALKELEKAARKFWEAAENISPGTEAWFPWFHRNEPERLLSEEEPLSVDYLRRGAHDVALIAASAFQNTKAKRGRRPETRRDAVIRLGAEAVEKETGSPITWSRGTQARPEPHFKNAGGRLLRDFFKQVNRQIGDCRDPLAYDRLLIGDLIQLVITDPPYGCAIENNVSGGGRIKHQNFVAGSGEVSLAEFGQTLIRPSFKEMARHCQSGAIAFVFTDWRAAPYMLEAANGVFDEVKQLIVWVKTNAGQGAFYRSAYELIYAFKVSPGTHINNFGLGQNGRYRTNVWTYPGANVFRKGRMKDLADHPTVKNSKMIADAILDCSKPGGIIMDSYLGSGTTLCAAAKTGRRGRGIELDPKYTEVALRRVADETGQTPMLDGVPLHEVATARKAEGHRDAA